MLWPVTTRTSGTFFRRQFRPWWQLGRWLLGGSWLLLASTGCLTSRMAAERILSAPNLHRDLAGNQQMLAMWRSLETNVLAKTIEQPLRYETILVGPPAAELQVLMLPAQDYHLSVTSRFSTNRAGRGSLGLWITTNTLANFSPRPRPATLVLLHGYMMSKESMLPWGLALAQAGYRIVLVDLRGHGASTGREVGFGKYEVGDMRVVLDELLARGVCDAEVGVVGYSYGGTLSLHWAAADPRIKAVVAMAPYNQPTDAFERLADALNVPLTHRTAQQAATRAAERLQLEWSDWSGATAMHRMTAPALLIGAVEDTIARPEDLELLKQSAAGPVEVRLVVPASHFSLGLSLHLLQEPMIAWLNEQLAAHPAP